MPYIIETKFGDCEIKKTIAPLTVSIIHAYASLCNLLSSNDFSIFNNEFYNYIHNGMNNLGEAFNIEKTVGGNIGDKCFDNVEEP